MYESKIIQGLSRNRELIRCLLEDCGNETVLWKPEPARWCLLEIICHLYDEEREDFRKRVLHVLDTPDLPLSPINPEGWITEHEYLRRNFNEVLGFFLEERSESVRRLNKLENPDWSKAINHMDLGRVSAGSFLVNWLAHDFQHIQQIVRLKYDYLKNETGESLEYAGKIF